MASSRASSAEGKAAGRVRRGRDMRGPLILSAQAIRRAVG